MWRTAHWMADFLFCTVVVIVFLNSSLTLCLQLIVEVIMGIPFVSQAFCGCQKDRRTQHKVPISPSHNTLCNFLAFYADTPSPQR